MPDKEFSKVSFYIVAHADDWQLFMQPNAYDDLVEPGTKVVFIIATAGDAGFGETFWLAREEGLKSSVRFCISPYATIKESTGTLKFSEHSINYWLLNRASCYFLRLPDGNLNGAGFDQYNYQSLSKLKTSVINKITAVDNSTIYNSWFDLSGTLQEIIEFEASDIQRVFINYINPDTGKNPGDHDDHIATGCALQNMPIISRLQQVLFVGYSVSKNGESLKTKELFWKSGMFAAYEKAVYDATGYSTLKESIFTYQNWCLTKASFITTDSYKYS